MRDTTRAILKQQFELAPSELKQFIEERQGRLAYISATSFEELEANFAEWFVEYSSMYADTEEQAAAIVIPVRSR